MVDRRRGLPLLSAARAALLVSLAGSGWGARRRRGLHLAAGARAAWLVPLSGGEWDGKLSSRSSSALSGQGGADGVPGWWAGRGQTDVEAFVCPQQSGRHCSCHWRVVCEGGGQTDVDAFVCSQRPGRHCMCLRPVVGGSRLTSRPSSTLGGPGRHCLCHWLVVSKMAN